MFDIIPMETRHLDRVYAIEAQSFSVPWSRKMLEDELAKNDMSLYYVAVEDDGTVVGYAGMWHVVNEGHITNIAVSPEKRRGGLGEALMGRLIAEARERGMIGLLLEVRVNNYDAQRLYLRNGFKLESIRKNYYSDTKEDALVMWKALEY